MKIDPIAYYRVSTDKQDVGIDVQRDQVTKACAARGWMLPREFEEHVSGKSMNRPELQLALKQVRKEHGVLIVAKLDRLSRSVADFATLMDQARKEGWSLIALDLGVDMTTPAGEFMANIVASVAQMERRLIGQRTKDALAVKIAQGVKVGRPCPTSVAGFIRYRRRQGDTLQAIADGLNRLGVKTAHGGTTWRPSSVRSVALRITP